MMPVQSVLNAIIIEVARRFLDNETILESTNNSLTLSFSLCQNQVDTDSQKCGQLQSAHDYLIFTNIVLAVSYIIIAQFIALYTCLAMNEFKFLAFIGMQFMQKRSKLCSTCLWGRPGILIPVDLLYHSKYRLIYVAMFGSMSSVFLKVVIGGSPTVSILDIYSSTTLSILVALLYIAILCILYYPLFASVSTPIPIVGHLIGTVFAISLLVLILLREYIFYTGCSTGCQMDNLPFAVRFFSDAPVVLLEFFLVLWFLYNIGYDIYLISKPSKTSLVKQSHVYLNDHLERVKHCLKRHVEDNSKSETKLKKFLLKIYPYDSSFKFPLRFLAGIIISIVIVYQLSLTVIGILIIFTIALNNISMQLVELLIDIEVFVNEVEADDLNTVLNPLKSVAQIIGYAGYALGSLLIIAVIIATIFCAIQFYLTFRNVSKHLHLSSRGDISFLPSGKYPTLQTSIMSSFRYPGYLIAYSIWAWIVYTSLVIIAEVILLSGLAIFALFIDRLGPPIIVAFIGLAWTQAFYWSQLIVTKFIFIQKAYPDSEHQVLNNRRLMHWFAFFCLFQNAFVGLFSTLIRIIKSFAVNLLTFSRLDKVLFIKGLESFDSANRTYIGTIYLDYIQNNSIMNVFCHLMFEQIHKNNHSEGVGDIMKQDHGCYCNKPVKSSTDIELVNLQSDEEEMAVKDPPRPYVSQRAYNRWRVAYTLIRNKELIELTGTNLTERSQSVIDCMSHMKQSYVLDDDIEIITK